MKKVKEHIKEKETGSLSQLMTQYLNKHTSVTTRQVIQDKLDYLNKKGGKSVAQALTYGKANSVAGPHFQLQGRKKGGGLPRKVSRPRNYTKGFKTWS